MIRKICISAILLLIGGFRFLATSQEKSTIKIYPYLMNPREYSDDTRRWIKPPDRQVFEGKTQFIALRSLDGDYKNSLDIYTKKEQLGKVIWPHYSMLYRNDLEEAANEIKQRGLYLFDIWGYVPGSGPGGVWRAFQVPANTLEIFQRVLGDRWLGMDNGEQDGRYVGGFSGQMLSASYSREEQYLNFQNHFQGLTDRLGNKMSALVSLNYGHYFLKEGNYCLIGAETAQGLPNSQIYYAFIRGAGKQYGVPWFGNASVWNRWGWKNYEGITSDNGGNEKGTSLSLLKRLLYSHILYNSVAVGFETSFFDKTGKLSPIGKIQQSANFWVEKNGDPGILYTPVAVMSDFFAGWTFPRHLYTSKTYQVWGNLPYGDGDYLMDGILNLLYPGYQDASYYHNEKGFLTATPFGDIADCLLSDAPLSLLQQYPVLIIGGELKGGEEIKDKLKAYVRAGGHLVLTSGNLERLPGGIFDWGEASSVKTIQKGSDISCLNKRITEPEELQVAELTIPASTEIIASCNDKPLAFRKRYGKGIFTLFASRYGINHNSLTNGIIKAPIDEPLLKPYVMAEHVKTILSDILAETAIFSTNPELSLITCRKEKGFYTLAVTNNNWEDKPFTIEARHGKIQDIKELKIDESERKAIGFLPENLKANPGKNSSVTIAGGDIRIFSVRMDEENIEEIPYIPQIRQNEKRGLALRNCSSIKKEILLRPTFFQHFDRVLVDWKYLDDKDTETLKRESGWIKQQSLKVIVDLTSGINLFPDLRLVNNDSVEFRQSMQRIESLLKKMELIGASDLLLAFHREPENNFTTEQYNASLKEAMHYLAGKAADASVNVHLRLAASRDPEWLDKAITWVESLNEKNLFVAPSLASLEKDENNAEKNSNLLHHPKCRILLLSSVQKDIQGRIWNYNLPVYQSDNKSLDAKFLSENKQKIWILDGSYNDQDEEYLDMKLLNDLKDNE